MIDAQMFKAAFSLRQTNWNWPMFPCTEQIAGAYLTWHKILLLKRKKLIYDLLLPEDIRDLLLG